MVHEPECVVSKVIDQNKNDVRLLMSTHIPCETDYSECNNEQRNEAMHKRCHIVADEIGCRQKVLQNERVASDWTERSGGQVVPDCEVSVL